MQRLQAARDRCQTAASTTITTMDYRCFGLRSHKRAHRWKVLSVVIIVNDGLPRCVDAFFMSKQKSWSYISGVVF